jgi:hypothetical protein
METQVCVQCGIEKQLTDFNVSFQGENAKAGFTQRVNYKKRCKTCYSRRERLRIRLAFIKAFDSRCECCGEDDPRFLGLDHKQDDGNEHRLAYNCQQIYYQAKKEGYPRDKYQLLCHNCNFGKSTNKGICPHKSQSKEDYLKEIEEFTSHTNLDARKNYNKEGLKYGPQGIKISQGVKMLQDLGVTKEMLDMALSKISSRTDLIE